MASAARPRIAPPDPTIYPVSDARGEDLLHRLIAELLRPLVQRWVRTQGQVARVGANQFIYWA
jgi:hypothetical protein